MSRYSKAEVESVAGVSGSELKDKSPTLGGDLVGGGTPAHGQGNGGQESAAFETVNPVRGVAVTQPHGGGKALNAGGGAFVKVLQDLAARLAQVFVLAAEFVSNTAKILYLRVELAVYRFHIRVLRAKRFAFELQLRDELGLLPDLDLKEVNHVLGEGGNGGHLGGLGGEFEHKGAGSIAGNAVLVNPGIRNDWLLNGVLIALCIANAIALVGLVVVIRSL